MISQKEMKRNNLEMKTTRRKLKRPTEQGKITSIN
jgi:hypothetical protein